MWGRLPAAINDGFAPLIAAGSRAHFFLILFVSLDVGNFTIITFNNRLINQPLVNDICNLGKVWIFSETVEKGQANSCVKRRINTPKNY